MGTGTRSSKKALEGAAKNNFDRFVKKIPANSKSSVTFKQLKEVITCLKPLLQEEFLALKPSIKNG